ncbi:hypothetical protein Poli38472_007479 [Pythium oligandrum]|uniref:Uncharacterized protein n=1 Tax=Pythium oligandrum TaxID=41045 RepID=A0A8K1CQ88_PYTOL|nr:hypothetical protein Poli38472_007479 [Pythium oligandrum]|eukprot:TMW67807.1 hypothetical protein Poli38472_007479 [Pythium oligandrum]
MSVSPLRNRWNDVLTRSFGSRSASAVASVDDDDTFRSDQKAPASSNTASSNQLDTSDPKNLVTLLEQSIAQRDPGQALAYFNCLESPPSLLVSQKLAILLAKQDSLHQTRRAHEILQTVYNEPKFQVDDYTQLASIFVVDACIRHQMLTEATEIVNKAETNGVALDVSAYDSYLNALVRANMLDEAVKALRAVVEKKDVLLSEQTFQPLLQRLMKDGQYNAVINLIDHGRQHDVKFTFETYDPLVEMAEDVDDSDDEEIWETLERFMRYINEALEEDGLTGLTEDDEDDEGGVTIEVDYDDGDDDDDDDDGEFDTTNQY